MLENPIKDKQDLNGGVAVATLSHRMSTLNVPPTSTVKHSANSHALIPIRQVQLRRAITHSL